MAHRLLARALLLRRVGGAGLSVRRVAVIGAGIAGLAAAWHLSPPGGSRGAASSSSGLSLLGSTLDEHCRVTLFEADARAGGHANTVDVSLPGADGRVVTHGVDTGFLVLNERTYPRLIALFQQLGVDLAPSDMSFSVQAEGGQLEWSGRSLDAVFAQRRNLLNPRFIGMLRELLRFNRLATALAASGEEAALRHSIGEFLDEHRFSPAFRQWYLLPMIGCIWSSPTDQMLRFPVATMIRFCHNHGLLQINDRPQWMTVRGGSRHYVSRMLERIPDLRLSTPVLAVRREPGGAGVHLHTARGTEHFDEVIFACHSDQALRILGADATLPEREVLGAIRYRPNRAVLHTDTRLLPRRQRAWAAWNYEHAAARPEVGQGVCLHYLINLLQPLPFKQPVLVSLNPLREPRADQVVAQFDYAHPVFDAAAIGAQQQLPRLQGQRHTWFCGAWAGHGFHEDGLKSALDVVQALRARRAEALAA